MREIKFRGYDNENKCWRFGNLARLQEGIRKFWAIICENLEDSGFDRFYIHNEKSIGQYTGLKDKNGVDIFEGDLLQSFYDDGEIHEVIWHEESASFRVATYLDNRHGGSFAELFFMDDIHENCNKIIGNIYENTELLEYKNEKD